jgi:hypothetical protein
MVVTKPLGVDGPVRALAATIARLYTSHPVEARELERQLMALAFAIEKVGYVEQHKTQGFYQESNNE